MHLVLSLLQNIVFIRQLYYTHGKCGTHVKLSNLTTMTKINYLNMATYDYSVTFDDVVTLKLKYVHIYIFYFLITKKNETII